MTQLRKITAQERKERKLGSAVAFELSHSHMGAEATSKGITVYLGRSGVVALHDATEVAAKAERRTMEEILWVDLMACVERLMGDDPRDETFDEVEQQQAAWESYGADKGRAVGLAYSIAVLRNPLAPDIEAIRAESVERWEEAERIPY